MSSQDSQDIETATTAIIEYDLFSRPRLVGWPEIGLRQTPKHEDMIVSSGKITSGELHKWGPINIREQACGQQLDRVH